MLHDVTAVILLASDVDVLPVSGPPTTNCVAETARQVISSVRRCITDYVSSNFNVLSFYSVSPKKSPPAVF